MRGLGRGIFGFLRKRAHQRPAVILGFLKSLPESANRRANVICSICVVDLVGLRVAGLGSRVWDSGSRLGVKVGYCPHSVTVHIGGPIKGYVSPY